MILAPSHPPPLCRHRPFNHAVEIRVALSKSRSTCETETPCFLGWAWLFPPYKLTNPISHTCPMGRRRLEGLFRLKYFHTERQLRNMRSLTKNLARNKCLLYSCQKLAMIWLSWHIPFQDGSSSRIWRYSLHWVKAQRSSFWCPAEVDISCLYADM